MGENIVYDAIQNIQFTNTEDNDVPDLLFFADV